MLIDSLSARAVSRAVLMVIVCGWITGCGSSGPKMGQVSGKVTYKGQPVAKATVTFIPAEQGSRPGIGITNEAGEFNLTTAEPGDGVLAGNCKVAIVARAPFEGKLPAGVGEAFLEEVQNQGKALIPEKYFNPESSQLVAEVKEGSNTVTFDLQ